ncbi:Protein of unknown function [Amycolatopsis arida]|uniref:DUF2752 domain-containing protein n=1 Tax=Amycolatopsis arida TaxID=587909 RepID=A0A1I6ALV1_9PSEU|nr:DUF2752 domain-containing protein [Amycolatopsis arida]TDX87391.1 uncharacterized protein DUF2752 [Amycolatopsis arida]SFQ69691.1 Protein of unknown function [Amycolatopsis arida]
MAASTVVTWSGRDRARGWTTAAVVFAVGAVVLRIVGVPPVDVHGVLHYVGVMDPLCGGTRATYLLLAGRPGAAAAYNPAVFPLAAAALALLTRAAVGLVTGRWLDVRWPRPWRRVLLGAVVLAVVALTVRQQLHAELLLSGWPA